MKKVSVKRSCIFLCTFCLAVAISAYGQSSSNQPNGNPPAVAAPYQSTPQPFWAEHGRLTYGFQFGFGLENDIPHNISHINLLIAQPQIGMIVWNSPHSRLPIKRFEVMSEGMLGGSTRPGGELLGGALFFRFGLKPMGRVVPFFDAGSGPLHTTIDHNAYEITGNTQFLSQGGFGLQYFYRPDRALVFEYRYFHMSNAGIQEPNPGFNGSMITIGFRWLRGPRSPAMAASQHHRFRFPRFW